MPGSEQRRVHDDPARDLRRILRGEGVAHHVADVVGDQLGLVDPEPVEDARHVVALRFLVVAALGMGRQAHAAQVGHDDRASVDQRRCKRRPHVVGVAEAVQHDDRRALAADPRMDGGAVGFDLLDTHAGREGLDHELFPVNSDFLDKCLRRCRIAYLGAGNEIDEGVALPGPRLGALGPFVDLGGLVARLDLLLSAH
jgi:hypothetical protein